MDLQKIFLRLLRVSISLMFLGIALPGISAEQQTEIIGKTVYVDSKSGNDSNSGLSAKAAWRSLERVNQSTFGPGAKVLLRAGSIWNGQLHPKGSGSKAKPIIIDKYGKGSKPLINGNGMVGEGVVRLFNQQYWELNNLEIINDAESEGDRRGVEIKASNYGLASHFRLKNLDIHNIKGIPGDELKSKATAGIYIATVKDDEKPTRFDDILIENCRIYNIDNQGIVTNNETVHNDYPGTTAWHQRKFTNLLIRNNIIHHISKNAVIARLTEGGVIERNLCYETALKTTGNTIFSRSAKGTVFQYNEGFLNRSPDYDGSLYDPDLHSPETVWQYSYSHDNAHGLVWFCTSEADTGVTVRYNISRNDKGSLVYFNYALGSARVHNNVFYIDSNRAPVIIRENRLNNHSYSFYNNIIFNNSLYSSYSLSQDGKGTQTRDISHNIFHGLHPEGEPHDPAKITSDPMFVDPLMMSAISVSEGFKLKPESPAIGSGRGAKRYTEPRDPSHDYWNKKKHLNRGIFDGRSQ